MNQNYILAKEHLDYIMEQQEELENEYDDLLGKLIGEVAKEIKNKEEKNDICKLEFV